MHQGRNLAAIASFFCHCPRRARGGGANHALSGIVRLSTARYRKIIVPAVAATFNVLAQNAFVLPPDQRIALAHRLLSSAEPGLNPDAEAAWEQEIARRVTDSDAGEVTPIPAAEVFARLRRIAPERP